MTLRLSVVLTHPIQYYAPWFRYMAAHCPEIDLTVLYVTQPTPEQQGVGFGLPFTWDTPITDGYRYRVLRQPDNSIDVNSGNFWGVRARGIGSAIKESAPDVVLLPGWHSATYLQALYYCRRHRIPVLFRGDTHLGNCPPGWRGQVWRARTRLLLRAFDGYLVVGTRTREYLSSFGIPESRLFNCPHCVDNEFFAAQIAPYQNSSTRAQLRRSFGIDANDFVVLFVGKLQKNKRPDDVLDAVAHLGKSVSVLLVGTGELSEALRAQAARLNVRLMCAEFLNQSQLGQAYASADCLVLPSASETWGLVVNEAMAAGLPCVVSDRVGCAFDLVKSGETGEIFRMGDAGDLASALERLKQKKERGHDWSAQCRARVALFSLEAATRGLVAACQHVRERSGSQGPRVLACCGHMVVIGGLERMTFEVLRVLRNRGTAVHCIVNSWENHRIVALAEEIGATWSIGRYYATLSRTRNPIKLTSALWDIVATSSGLLRDSWRFRPSHILVPEFGSVLRNAPSILLLRLLGIPVIFRVGNVPPPGRFYRLLWGDVLPLFVTCFVPNSGYTTRKLIDCGILPKKITTIVNAVSRVTVAENFDSDAMSLVRSRCALLCVGQIAPFKGTHLFVHACLELLRAGYDVQGIVVGRIPVWPPELVRYLDELRKEIDAGASGRISFVGERKNISEIMRASYVLAVPITGDESFGNVALEAKSVGLPVVAFPTGGLPELLDDRVTGYLCHAPDLQELLDGLRFFLDNPDARGRCSAASLALMSDPDCEYSYARFASRWQHLFEEVGH